jgi:hypothetical protein
VSFEVQRSSSLKSHRRSHLLHRQQSLDGLGHTTPISSTPEYLTDGANRPIAFPATARALPSSSSVSCPHISSAMRDSLHDHLSFDNRTLTFRICAKLCAQEYLVSKTFSPPPSPTSLLVSVRLWTDGNVNVSRTKRLVRNLSLPLVVVQGESAAWMVSSGLMQSAPPSSRTSRKDHKAQQDNGTDVKFRICSRSLDQVCRTCQCDDGSTQCYTVGATCGMCGRLDEPTDGHGGRIILRCSKGLKERIKCCAERVQEEGGAAL